jgi:hypothetical protein
MSRDNSSPILVLPTPVRPDLKLEIWIVVMRKSKQSRKSVFLTVSLIKYTPDLGGNVRVNVRAYIC